MQIKWQRGKFTALLQVCPYRKSKISDLIRQKKWIEGLHFVVDDAGDRIFNLTLIEDWIANLGDPAAHQRACEAYSASLPSNQPPKRGTPKSTRAAA